MRELLFGLTPAEFWAWNYLIYLARQQGTYHIILPRPGADVEAEKVFGRKHLKRLLKALKVKRHLTNLLIHNSKARQIEVLLPAAKVGDLGVPNLDQRDRQVPNDPPRGTARSPINPLRTCGSSIGEVISGVLPPEEVAQAKLKEKLERLLKLKQGCLKRELLDLTNKEVFQLGIVLRRLCKYLPKGKAISEPAKLYAMVRLIQAGETIESPQPWVDNVAREAQRELEQGWNGNLSGRAGKSPSHVASGGR